MESEAPPPHIAMFSTTGKGHLFPLTEFIRSLLRLHPFTITLIIPDDGSSLKPQKELLQTIPSVNLTVLPPVNFDDVPPESPVETLIVLSVTRSIPALTEYLADLNRSARLTALVVDGFTSLALDDVKGFGIPVYLFHTSSTMDLSFNIHLPELDQSCTCEYRDLPEPLKLPGCVPLPWSDSPIPDRKESVYHFILDLCKKYGRVDGVLVNSFRELEPEIFKALEEAGKPVYPVGPLIRHPSGSTAECLKWLDKQPEGSVLYISFGSGGTLSSQQLKELATGLDMSGQRFLFVVRKPNDAVRSGALLSGSVEELDPREYLPLGFMDRVKGRGLVVAQWAPQVDVLSHSAVGGFLTHCGWNSTLEGIVHGVPLIAWPLFGDQPLNAVLVSKGLRVGYRVREDEKGAVDGKEIAEMMRRLMEGEEGVEMRQRAGKLKDAAKRALEEDGLSFKTLVGIVEKWK